MRNIKPKNFNLDDLPKICEDMKAMVNSVTDLAKQLGIVGYDQKILETRTRVLDYLRDSRDYALWLQDYYENEFSDVASKKAKEQYDAELTNVRADIGKAIEVLIDHSFLALDR